MTVMEKLQADTRDDLRAIIDIGSNTVRMVIYAGPPRAPTVLFNEKVTARLGKGVAEDGRLSPKSRATALAALSRFALLLRLHGVRDVRTVATAAARDASDGAAFLDEVRALGLTPRLLSGEEEAIASAHGVLAGFPGARGIVGDLGGGSLELIDIDGTGCTHGVSLPLGTLRLPALRAEGPTKF
ncbi:MAG TPA: exopolyphosphatase, partial [Novosphingobium sp.]|nr:exopolyphosphatase [Novosphingobium sp.]